MTSTSPVKYTLIARLLHWLVALGIVAAFGIALYEDDLKFSLLKIKLINYHKWIGLTVLILAAVRLVWRLTHAAPKPPAHMKPWEKTVASVTHGLLYLLMFCVPIGGWLYSSAKGFPIVLFGVIPFPSLIDKNEAIAHTIKQWHGLGAWLVIILASLHALAALKHRFIDRDDVLQRML